MLGGMYTIGRRPSTNLSQWPLDDPLLSRRHLRIHSSRVLLEDAEDTDWLVFVEDVSKYGTYWNGSLVGSKNASVLLSNGDRLVLTARTSLVFEQIS